MSGRIDLCLAYFSNHFNLGLIKSYIQKRYKLRNRKNFINSKFHNFYYIPSFYVIKAEKVNFLLLPSLSLGKAKVKMKQGFIFRYLSAKSQMSLKSQKLHCQPGVALKSLVFISSISASIFSFNCVISFSLPKKDADLPSFR